MNLFDSLNAFHKIDYIEAESPEELKTMLQALNFSFSIITIYRNNSRHIAWINPVKKLKDKDKKRS